MPEHRGTRSRTDFPLRDRRSRRLWENRNGRLDQTLTLSMPIDDFQSIPELVPGLEDFRALYNQH